MQFENEKAKEATETTIAPDEVRQSIVPLPDGQDARVEGEVFL